MDRITETSLQALIQRATDSRNKSVDQAAIDACCGIIKKMPDAAYFASKEIAGRLQSQDEWEAIQGLTLLEDCMQKCGTSFRLEVAKFRFLNELIKLVSPKFLGAKTSPKVRDKVLHLLFSWTANYPQEQKILEAFDMLRKQGVVTDDLMKQLSAAEPSTAKASNLLIDQEFEKKLQKLLSSKNAQDLDAANRMIKHKVYETERKVNDLERVRTSVRLLAEMMDSYYATEMSPDEVRLMTDIRYECELLRPTLTKLVENAPDGMVSDVMSAIEEMSLVVGRYTLLQKDAVDTIGSKNPTAEKKTTPAPSSLLDLSPVDGKPDSEPLKPSPNLLEGSLASFDLNPPVASTISLLEPSELPNSSATGDLEHLGDIFSAIATSLPSVSNSLSSLPATSRSSSVPPEKTSKQKALEDLDVLGETMLQKCKLDLEPARGLDSKIEPVGETMLNTSELLDDVMLGADEPILESKANGDALNNESAGHCVNTAPVAESVVPVKSLADVSVDLENIKPSGLPPTKIIESVNGVTVVLHLAKDTPRPDVSVYVVTTTSTSSQPLSDYHFQVKVPKGCKFKLQQSSATSLPPHNPFLPPSAITQILLIANPNALKIDLTCMISFTMDDETVTEVGEVKSLAPW